MDKKCTKYETLFTFRTDQELQEHIAQCPDCAIEAEKMKRVSELIQEVKPYYLKKRRKTLVMKVACALMLFMLSGITLGVVTMSTDVSDTLRYGTTLSSEDLGLPVDSYGLIMVE